MSRFRDSSRFADRLRDMSDDELLQEMKQRFSENSDKFFEPRFSRRDCFERPFPHFPRGFSLDDDADIFDRSHRDGIRSHLDDLAARHPELAEHLRGPPWSFGSSLLRDRRRRRRGSGGSNSDGQQQQQQQQSQQVDEDARSQASGSSAASGASAVSSRSGDEPDLTSSSAIPQYGLRNTVDIGQQQRRRGMEMSPEMGDRGQRSMSAPPENRQQQQQQQQQGQSEQQQSQPGQGQRFVSRVDITPQHNQQQQRSQSPGKSSSNVRHIPIFVEGRDEPVMPKFKADKAPSPPPAFHQQYQRQPSPPSFHRPSHFNDHFSRQWPPGFYESSGFDPGFESSFKPMRRHQQFQQPQYYQEPQYQQQQPQYRQQQQPQYRQQKQQPPQQQYPQQQQPSPPPPPPPSPPPPPPQQQQQQETQKPKQVVPKDPLEKVADIQKEVDDLAEQVKRYVGGTRQDKEYMYLDEMLTRELIKLDDIETEGRENVRQARKNAIKSIQDTISLLETKAPLAGQPEQQPMQEENGQDEEQKKEEPSEAPPESMDVDVKQEKQNNEPIPLPPGPSSETKEKTESSVNETTSAESTTQSADPAAQQQTCMEIEQEAEKTEMKEPPVASALTAEAAKRADETSSESKPDGGEQRKGDDAAGVTESKDATLKPEEAKENKMEVDNGQQSSKETESPKVQKKAKKTKKKQQQQQQQPVSEQAIPLPPPSAESAK